jgi:hypothetical protein
MCRSAAPWRLHSSSHVRSPGARADTDRDQLLDSVLDVLVDPDVPDEAVGGLLRGGIGWDRLRGAHRPVSARPPRDHGHLELLDARYNDLRAFTPAVLATLPLAGGPDAATLLAAIDFLRELNATGRQPFGTRTFTGGRSPGPALCWCRRVPPRATP